ncbi:MAG: hypothetical protein E7616_03355 [Ruminococcaceae bacterium]|nr:hypothetical protein [Oscillospiraceae bacterium]
MLVLAAILGLTGLYCVINGIREAIGTTISGKFDSASIALLLVGIAFIALTVLLVILNDKRTAKKRSKEEIERDQFLETNGQCACARCGLNLRLIPPKDLKRDVKCIDGKLYCGVCAGNIAIHNSKPKGKDNYVK